MKLVEMLRSKGRVVINITALSTSRVKYEREGINRVEVSMELPTNEVLVLELTPEQCGELAASLASCYRAMYPHHRAKF